MAIKELLGFASIGCSMLGYGIYIVSVLRHRTKPHAFSWMVWAFVMGIVFFAQLSKDAGPGCWVTGFSAFCCFIIAALSLVHGEKNITPMDRISFIGALIAIPVWRLTHEPLAAVIMATIIDALAYTPTFRKSWYRPYEETFWTYAVDNIKWVFAFCAMTSYSFITLLYPGFLFVSNMMLVLMILWRRAARPTVLACALIVASAVFPALAQTPGSDVPAYQVVDVLVDMTSDSAAKARDMAISEAQRLAFLQLLERFDVDPAIAAKLKADDIATLVQSFEVQSERASKVRYIGVYTVRFRPNAVRSYLASKGMVPNDTQSRPVVVLPVYVSNGHPILWEENTRWRSAWDKDPHNDGLVPVILPSGALDDIQTVATEDAMSGKTDPLKAAAAKYQAGGVIVAALNGSADNPSAGFTIDVTRYDENGNAIGQPEKLTLAGTADKNAVDYTLLQGVRQVRHVLEKDWKSDTKTQLSSITPVAGADTTGAMGQDPSVQAALDGTPAIHLPVTVQIVTLNEWAQIRRKLTATPGVSGVSVQSLQRGSANIELEFHGSLPGLQAALQQQQLRLFQDLLSNSWTIQPL